MCKFKFNEKKEKDVVCPDLSKDPKIYETSCPKRDQPTSRRAANINQKVQYNRKPKSTKKTPSFCSGKEYSRKY